MIQLQPDDTNSCETLISILNGRNHTDIIIWYGPDDDI